MATVTVHHGDSREVLKTFADASIDSVVCDPPYALVSIVKRFAKADAEDRLGSKHPTVKPVDLMRYLIKLVTPPAGVVLDPFAGSGSTGIAAIWAGFDAVLIEREAEYVADIHRRIAWAKGEGRLTAQEVSRHPVDDPNDLPLFSQPASQPASHDDAGRAAKSTGSSQTKAHRADGNEEISA